MVLIMERWFQGFLGYRSVFATVLVAFLTALFFNPLREQLQALVDRALFNATPAELAAQREQLLSEVQKSEQIKAIGTLAAGLAHEIKNPLTSIRTFTDHLAREGADPAFREKFSRIVGPEIERINEIVQRLLDFAKPAPPVLRNVELSILLSETLELLNGEIIGRKIAVSRELAESWALGDPKQLKQVMLNILLNSIEAMNGDGRLTVKSGTDVEHAWITIADNGSGVAPEHLVHLGQPFFSTKPKGTGLGLAIVQSIIQKHQGRVSVESKPGHGTTVELRLPLASSPA
jgi:two-component system sensor histidine kinase HydH